MLDRSQQLTEAAMRYQELLDAGQLVSIDEFIAAAPVDLRVELREYLEFSLALGDPDFDLELTEEEVSMSKRAGAKAWARFTARSLLQLRNERKLNVAALARQVNLPADLMLRIERGAVRAATVPGKLVDRLAAALSQSAEVVRAALASPPPMLQGAPLSAADGTVERPEEVVSFQEALAASLATPEQRTEWEADSQ